MNTKRSIRVIAIVLASLLAVSLSLSGCGAAPLAAPTPTMVPTPSLSETGWKDFAIPDFAGVHAPVGGDANQHLIFGDVPVSAPQADLPGELAAFLGRWEGFDYSPPVKRDVKGVLIIQEISADGGRALLWAGTNLQYPDWVKEIDFRVVTGPTPLIEWQADVASDPNGASGAATFRFAYDPATGRIRGGINIPAEDILNGPAEFEDRKSVV